MLSRFVSKELSFFSRKAIIAPIVTSSVKSTPTLNYNTFSFNNQLINRRFNSTSSNSSQTIGQIKVDKPQLMIAFKCKKCDTRSSHVMSKQAYTSGTVLVTCPGCKNRHLIADHLKVNDRITIQDILAAKGESVSQSTDDLVFDEIPDKLKTLIGHHAKDAPNKPKVNNEEDPHFLPEGKN
ncbi:hypothetical protein WICPIJ_005213 [Wickerhamomyces pijperi]|uniref:DNL-type domain-containing protein n=1 Tax=Wickerhamomyces pijperi TaxID=599730 RepID=A0A9P8TM67_WICPI|nr:hypothetical protein WICPIJ_005213 [Wickerhamomyces pijperi]